jgi:hypothetical protein
MTATSGFALGLQLAAIRFARTSPASQERNGCGGPVEGSMVVSRSLKLLAESILENEVAREALRKKW